MKKKIIVIATRFLMVLGVFSCAWDQSSPKVDCSLSVIQIAVDQLQHTGCESASGSFQVTASGGVSPYVYVVGSTQNTDGIFENMQAGTYDVVATDANGCDQEIEVVIQNLDGVNIDDLQVTDAGCGSSEGRIEVHATGGQSPYSYSINGSSAQADGVFTGLGKGSYNLSIVDQLGCEIVQEVEVLSGVSYEASVKSIISNSCAVSGCHSGSVFPDFRSFETIQAHASSIKSRTASGSMPKGSSLSQAQKDIIACWVEDGALQN